MTAAAFPFTVSTTGRLLFLICLRNSLEWRRKVVRGWMSLGMFSMAQYSTFKGASNKMKQADFTEVGAHSIVSLWKYGALLQPRSANNIDLHFSMGHPKPPTFSSQSASNLSSIDDS